MSRLAWLLILAALPASTLCGEAPKTGQRDPGADGAFLIDPSRSIGHITPACSEKDLIRVYGARSVRRARIDLGEGESAEGSGWASLQFGSPRDDQEEAGAVCGHRPLGLMAGRPNL